MIAPIEQPVSSVVRIAQEACEAEGCSLDTLRLRRRRRGRYGSSPNWMRMFSRVCARMRDRHIPPSYPEIAAVFGTSFSTINGAARRGRAMLDMERQGDGRCSA